MRNIIINNNLKIGTVNLSYVEQIDKKETI